MTARFDLALPSRSLGAALAASPAAVSPVVQPAAEGSQIPFGGASTAAVKRSAADPNGPGWRVEALQGWHLPLLDDPSFLPLQPVLQRSLLWALPDRLLTALRHRSLPSGQALVALRTLPGGQQRVLGLIVCRALNRSGSCWQVEHLRLPIAATDIAATEPAGSTTSSVNGGPSRRDVSLSLLREAIQRARGAASWLATCSSLDTTRLALLREQGFQPQRTDQLWRWRPAGSDATGGDAIGGHAIGGDAAGASGAAVHKAAVHKVERHGIPLPAGLKLVRLQRSSAPLLWHLEQAICPAQLRQLLDRRIEDLLDQSGHRGWMLVDDHRNVAVAGVRWLQDHPEGGWRVALSVHPAWQQLLGAPCEQLLRCLAGGSTPLWISSEVGDHQRRDWLSRLGAEPQQEEVLMARSVWRRQGRNPARQRVARLGAVLEQFHPRRQPLPTPARGLLLRWQRP